jgi:hypothetical protein
VNPVQNIPAPIVPATGGESKAYGLLRLDDDTFAKEFGLDTIVPENAQPRDVNGQFIAKDTVLVDTTLSKPVVEQPTTVAGTLDTPTAPAAEKPVAEGESEKPVVEGEQPKPKPPLTKFAVLGEDGQPVELPAVKLQFKDNGKDVSYDVEKVVSLAQMNSHNARQVQALTETVGDREQRLQQYESTFGQYENEIARMFTHPEVYEEARTRWLEANSPEKRAERAEARVTSLTVQQNEAVEAGRMAEFVSGTIAPSLQQLAEQFPSVTEEDLLGRFALALPAYQVNGRVPLANLPKLQQFVETDLAQYAQSVHDRRAQAIASAKADADKSLQKEQATTQALKRQVGKVLAPVSGNAVTPPAQQPTTIKKASDVFNDPLFGGGK